MSADLYRVRKQIKALFYDPTIEGEDYRLYRAGLAHALSVLDDELEALAETEFQRPIKPTDPVRELIRHPVNVAPRPPVDLNPPLLVDVPA